MRVLVAEDEPASVHIIEATLRSLGHEVHTVADGMEAWVAFRADQPDVVISDWMMPGLSGLDLCRNIRRDHPDSYTYFIMVTGRDAEQEVLTGMSAGVDDYLIKPLVPNVLEARLIAATRVTSLHRRLGRQRSALEDLNHDLTALTVRDALTGLGNRRALDHDLEQLDAQATRYGHRYCIALFDVDLFKAYNDLFGHPAGDAGLRAVATQLRRTARRGDTVYRYGGEEFLCTFPEQSLETGAIAVDRMRTGVEGLAIPHPGNPGGLLTISAGVAMLGGAPNSSSSDVLKRADEALYRAKALGRNRVEHVAGADPSPLANALRK